MVIPFKPPKPSFWTVSLLKSAGVQTLPSEDFRPFSSRTVQRLPCTCLQHCSPTNMAQPEGLPIAPACETAEKIKHPPKPVSQTRSVPLGNIRCDVEFPSFPHVGSLPKNLGVEEQLGNLGCLWMFDAGWPLSFFALMLGPRIG